MLPAALEAAIVKAKEEGKVGPLACALVQLEQQVFQGSICMLVAVSAGRVPPASATNAKAGAWRHLCCAQLWEQPSGLDHNKLSDMLAAAVLCGDHSRNHCPGRV